MIARGCTQAEVCDVLQIAGVTLRKHYGPEILTARVDMLTAISISLFMQAVGGPKQEWEKAVPSATIFCAKTQLGYKEAPQALEHTGKDGGPVQIQRIERIVIDPSNRDA